MDIKSELFKSIDILVEKRLKNLSLNRYIEGKIVSINNDASCEVMINKEISKINKRDGLSVKVNDVVLICIVNNNYSTKFIDLKRPY